MKDASTNFSLRSVIFWHSTCLSPFSNYTYLASNLTGTGLRRLRYFEHLTSEYYQTLSPYLQNKSEQARQKAPIYKSNSFLAVTDRPRFSFQEELLLARLASGFVSWGILLFFNGLFFVIALVRFLRFYVR